MLCRNPDTNQGEESRPVLGEIESLNVRLWISRGMNDALTHHGDSRFRMVRFGMLEKAGEFAISAGEFLADYLLVQRAIAQDVWIASRRRARGESTASMLDRMDSGGRLHRRQMLAYVLYPTAIFKKMTEGMNSEQRQNIDEYLLTRSIPQAGVLAPFVQVP